MPDCHGQRPRPAASQPAARPKSVARFVTTNTGTFKNTDIPMCPRSLTGRYTPAKENQTTYTAVGTPTIGRCAAIRNGPEEDPQRYRRRYSDPRAHKGGQGQCRGGHVRDGARFDRPARAVVSKRGAPMATAATGLSTGGRPVRHFHSQQAERQRRNKSDLERPGQVFSPGPEQGQQERQTRRHPRVRPLPQATTPQEMDDGDVGEQERDQVRPVARQVLEGKNGPP